MFDNTLDLPFGGNTITMTRINQQGYSSEYSGLINNGNGDRVFKMTVKHSPAKTPGGDNSHLIRIDSDWYNTQGEFLRTQSTWSVLKTTGGQQDNTNIRDQLLGQQSLWTSALLDRVVLGES